MKHHLPLRSMEVVETHCYSIGRTCIRVSSKKMGLRASLLRLQRKPAATICCPGQATAQALETIALFMGLILRM